MRYPSDHDVAMRLGDTFVKYKDRCYFARATGKDFRLTLYTAADEFVVPVHIVSANNLEVDITSLEVGLQQISPERVLYVCRGPFRKQKQGICHENLVCKPLGLDKNYFESLNTAYLYSVSFLNMLEDKYPTYEEVHDSLSITPCQKAFSKKLALVINKNKMDLYLNCTKIAQKKRTDTHWFLDKDYNNTTTAMYLTSKGVPLY